MIEIYDRSMREVTLIFPISSEPEPRVLLGLKKDGFGAGKITGFGGGLEKGESPAVGAARELFEECGLKVSPDELKPCGMLEFVFSAKPNWGHLVHVFLAPVWSGEPIESDEMRPEWCAMNALPFERMWDDNRYWLPGVLAGNHVNSRFVFAADNQTVLEFVDFNRCPRV
jgi:8-oxo-dGTP pyrophosphatase MutT (NUDIX family)